MCERWFALVAVTMDRVVATLVDRWQLMSMIPGGSMALFRGVMVAAVRDIQASSPV